RHRPRREGQVWKVTYLDPRKLRVRYRSRFAVHLVFTIALAIIAETVCSGADLHDDLNLLTMFSAGMALTSWITLKDFS
ncbi:hypothetical protein ACXWPT_09280, partial [Streptococcus pyogenes]